MFVPWGPTQARVNNDCKKQSAQEAISTRSNQRKKQSAQEAISTKRNQHKTHLLISVEEQDLPAYRHCDCGRLR
jgi:hypothetical protein